MPVACLVNRWSAADLHFDDGSCISVGCGSRIGYRPAAGADRSVLILRECPRQPSSSVALILAPRLLKSAPLRSKCGAFLALWRHLCQALGLKPIGTLARGFQLADHRGLK
jgi:hypothetical protein